MCPGIVLLSLALAADRVAIPAGTFPMGCGRSECTESAGPVHTVSLSGYWIDRYEVTQAEWAECVAAGVCLPPLGRYDAVGTPTWPVVGIPRAQAVGYCAWRGGRLPTEAEWERAAAGADGRIYPWGADPPDCTRAQLPMCGAPVGPVGRHPAGASAEGVQDLVGNAWEIVSDYFDAAYYVASAAQDPTGGTVPFLATVRGPSTWTVAHQQVAFRLGVPIGTRSATLGFRCAGDNP